MAKAVKQKTVAKKTAAGKTPVLTAAEFIKRLQKFQSAADLKKYHRFFTFVENDKKETFIGVRMGQVFALAKEFIDMPPAEIEQLLESHIHEVRAGACSIMGKKAAAKKTTDKELKELADLYIRRHDRVNSWDLVDLAAHQLLGRYLVDKPRKVLYQLARSKNPMERRTAIVATAHFIKNKDVEDAYAIAELLLKDKEETIHKATGWMLRYAGDVNKKKLLSFLDKHAAVMPRITLRAAIEHFNKKEKEHYMGLKNA